MNHSPALYLTAPCALYTHTGAAVTATRSVNGVGPTTSAPAGALAAIAARCGISTALRGCSSKVRIVRVKSNLNACMVTGSAVCARCCPLLAARGAALLTACCKPLADVCNPHPQVVTPLQSCRLPRLTAAERALGGYCGHCRPHQTRAGGHGWCPRVRGCNGRPTST